MGVVVKVKAGCKIWARARHSAFFRRFRRLGVVSCGGVGGGCGGGGRVCIGGTGKTLGWESGGRG